MYLSGVYCKLCSGLFIWTFLFIVLFTWMYCLSRNSLLSCQRNSQTCCQLFYQTIIVSVRMSLRLYKYNALHPTYQVLSIYDLQACPAFLLPPTINRCRLEDYITDSQFLRNFRMTRDEFCEMPFWRQCLMKKRMNLFW